MNNEKLENQLNLALEATRLIFYKKYSVQGSKMYSESAAHAPLSDRSLSVWLFSFLLLLFYACL